MVSKEELRMMIDLKRACWDIADAKYPSSKEETRDFCRSSEAVVYAQALFDVAMGKVEVPSARDSSGDPPQEIGADSPVPERQAPKEEQEDRPLTVVSEEVVEAIDLMVATEQSGGDLWWKGWDRLKDARSRLSAVPKEEVRIYRPDSQSLIDGGRETWHAAGYDNPDKLEERFRGSMYRVWAVAWQESRLHLMGKSIIMPKDDHPDTH